MEAQWPRVAGEIPTRLVLPGGVGRQRRVLINEERWRHVLVRRGRDAHFCLGHMATVLRDPFWIGRRARGDLAEVDFARFVGEHRQLLLVAVKFIDIQREAWVSTVYPWSVTWLTRRLRGGTMRAIDGGP